MISRTPPAIRTLCLALAGTLSLGMAGIANADAEPATAELEQLDEIWVQGQNMADAITAAEDDFFALYNKLNDVQDFRISCEDMSLALDSMNRRRACLPRFLINAMWQESYESSFRTTGCYDSGERNSTYDFCSGYRTSSWSSVAQPLVSVRREGFAANIIQVIGTNPQLREKADRLATLYSELDKAQHRFVEVRKATGQRIRQPQRKPVTGPRPL